MDLVGKCLIARPSISDPYFKRSVVFVYEQNVQSVLGLVVNKKLPNASLTDILNSRGYESMINLPLFAGGPVNKAAVCMLHTAGWSSSNTLEINNRFGITSDDLMIYKFINGDMPDGHRFVMGSAVWHPQQIKMEIANSHWLISELSAHDIFDYQGREMWDRAIEKNAQQTIDKFF